jgi:hypothetical protein
VLGEQEVVDQHAVALHLEEHPGGGQLDVAVQRGEAGLGGELGGERVVQAQGDVGVLGGVFGGAASSTSPKPICLAPLPHTSV